MEIDGVSQSTGVERIVEVGAAETGILLVIRNRIGNAEQERMIAPAEELMAVLMDRPQGPQSLAGSADGKDQTLAIEVRRNEVLLNVGESDAAVGLDDLMDALAGVSS